MKRRFERKADARRAVWERLTVAKAAAFPFPIQGRIPNFKGARQAARRLFALEPWKSARRLKVNPDSPQRPVREEALRRGIIVFVPTPRLKGGFKKLDPAKIPADKIAEAANLATMDRWAVRVPLAKFPAVDAIVVGSVAVTRDGRRCGKGEGYGDIEFAILRELGHGPVPVATTVHPLQIVDGFPTAPTDLPLHVIVTPEETIVIKKPPPAPEGVDWASLDADDLTAMPVLKELKALTRRRRVKPKARRRASRK
jgi:5-formyltetrahydrofolate cyclo-ligase